MRKVFEFICALLWNLGKGLLFLGECILDPFTYVVDDVIEWGRDLLDEYRNRKNDTEI